MVGQHVGVLAVSARAVCFGVDLHKERVLCGRDAKVLDCRQNNNSMIKCSRFQRSLIEIFSLDIEISYKLFVSQIFIQSSKSLPLVFTASGSKILSRKSETAGTVCGQDMGFGCRLIVFCGIVSVYQHLLSINEDCNCVDG